MTKLKTESYYNQIRGKMLVNKCTQKELHDILAYMDAVEGLLDEADNDDCFGTEGWRHQIGLD